MDWLRESIDKEMGRIRNNVLFMSLNMHVSRLRFPSHGERGKEWESDYEQARAWVSHVVRQMRWQAREFTESLAARVLTCHDPAFKNVFAEHAAEEVAHPSELEQWMRHHCIELHAYPTQATLMLTAWTWRAAWREPPEVQVVVMNMIGEAVALEFYSRFIELLGLLDMLDGAHSRYWRTHKEIDSVHMAIGLDLCQHVTRESPLGYECRRAAITGIELYDEALASWDMI